LNKKLCSHEVLKIHLAGHMLDKSQTFEQFKELHINVAGSEISINRKEKYCHHGEYPHPSTIPIT
jgi:hypothetical protein